MRTYALALSFTLLVSAGCDDTRQRITQTMGPEDMSPMLPLFPDCMDNFRDQGESDVDCGGPCTKKCAGGQMCKVKTDCASTICVANKCEAVGVCHDGMRDGDETDLDCGGSCPPCGYGKVCAKATDCQSGVCTGTSCASLTAALGNASEITLSMAMPVAVVAGDFDGDGVVDIAALSGMVPSVYIAPGKGDGTFQPPVGITCPIGDQLPDIMASGDVNGDGLPDIIVTTGGMAVVLLNESSPGMIMFAQPQTFPDIGTTPSNPVLVDLNGDGKLDLVSVDTNYDEGTDGYEMYVTTNGGGGMWNTPLRIFVGSDTPLTPTIADFDNDGHLDIAVLAGSGVQIAPGKGDGTFLGWKTSPVGMFNASRIAAGDFDANGNMDLVAIDTQGNAIGNLAGFGNGLVTKALVVAMPDSPFGLGVADFNLDAIPDVVILGSDANDDSIVALFMGQGANSRSLTMGPSVLDGSNPTTLIIADVNGDGHPDLVSSDPSDDQVVVVLNTSK